MSKQVLLGVVAGLLVGAVSTSLLRSEPAPVSVPTPEPTVLEVTVGLQPKYEAGFVVEAPCDEHGVDVFTVSRVLIAYELTVDGSPFVSLATEEQIDEVLAQSPK